MIRATTTSMVFTYVLTCDPDVSDLNDVEAIRAYHKSGDEGDLVLPEDPQRITIRALDADEIRAARAAAGRLPYRGRVLAGRLVGLDELAAAIAQDEMTDDELAAVEDFDAWDRRVRREICNRGVVDVPGWAGGWADVDRMPPLLRPTIVDETWARISALSSIGARGKEPCGLRSTSPPSPTDAGGATTASQTPA